MKFTLLLATAALAGSISIASAETAISKSEQNFVKRATIDGMAEVAAGQVAAQKGSNDQVKQFAKTMVADHNKMNAQLKQIAVTKGLTLPDTGKKVDRESGSLSKVDGQKLDQRYARMQVKDNAIMVKFFQREAEKGKDPELRKFASDTLATLQAHSDKAVQLASAVGVQPTEPRTRKQ
jgi:putative membrane protein